MPSIYLKSMYCSQYSVNEDPSKCAISSNNILEVFYPTNVADHGQLCYHSGVMKFARVQVI